MSSSTHSTRERSSRERLIQKSVAVSTLICLAVGLPSARNTSTTAVPSAPPLRCQRHLVPEEGTENAQRLQVVAFGMLRRQVLEPVDPAEPDVPLAVAEHLGTLLVLVVGETQPCRVRLAMRDDAAPQRERQADDCHPDEGQVPQRGAGRFAAGEPVPIQNSGCRRDTSGRENANQGQPVGEGRSGSFSPSESQHRHLPSVCRPLGRQAVQDGEAHHSRSTVKRLPQVRSRSGNGRSAPIPRAR